MSAFNFHGFVEILSVTPRRIGPEDNRELVLSVKLRAYLEPEQLEFFDERLAGFLLTDDGMWRNRMLDPINFTYEVRECEMTVHDWDDRHFTQVTVGRFQLAPCSKANRILFGFSIGFRPHGAEVGWISEQIKESLHIHLRPQQTDLFIQGEEEAADAIVLPGELDPLFIEASLAVRHHKRTSISFVQRTLRIGYNRAARLLEMMEQGGIVSAMASNGERTLLEILP